MNQEFVAKRKHVDLKESAQIAACHSDARSAKESLRRSPPRAGHRRRERALLPTVAQNDTTTQELRIR